VTATLHTLGVRAVHGAQVALLRIGPGDESAVIYHEANGPAEVEARAAAGAETVVLPDYPGQGWLDPATARLQLLGPGDDPGPIESWPVNTALRELGADRRTAADEAAAIGLRLPHHP
jgi:hypothetical protein